MIELGFFDLNDEENYTNVVVYLKKEKAKKDFSIAREKLNERMYIKLFERKVNIELNEAEKNTIEKFGYSELLDGNGYGSFYNKNDKKDKLITMTIMPYTRIKV
jgi:hypothetical protein